MNKFEKKPSNHLLEAVKIRISLVFRFVSDLVLRIVQVLNEQKEIQEVLSVWCASAKIQSFAVFAEKDGNP